MIKSIKTIKFAMIAGMPLLLASCFSAREYQRSEELPAMEGNYRTDQLVQDSLSLATVHWEDLFTDPILQKHRSEEHTSELQSRENLVCRLLLEKKKKKT